MTLVAVKVGDPPMKKFESSWAAVPTGRHMGQEISCVPGAEGTCTKP